MSTHRSEQQGVNKRGGRSDSSGGRGYEMADIDLPNKRSRVISDRRRDDDWGASDYYGPSTATTRAKPEDWKCLECKTWNYPDEFRCARCGTAAPYDARVMADVWRGENADRHGSFSLNAHRMGLRTPDFPNAQISNHREDHLESQDEAQDLDEFGRSVKSKPIPKLREWPLPFEKDGSAFVFDSRCGMFYESETDFFYDPKSKLYYGNKQGAYYSYNEESKSFDKVSTQTPDQALTLNPEPILDTGAGSKGTLGSKSITIKLKTKFLKKSKADAIQKAPSDPSSTEEGNQIRKQHSVDFEKWSARSKETQKSTKPDDAPITKTGAPICLLCRRKFSTLEKLQYHEKVSQLHKDNLAKQNLAAAGLTESSTVKSPSTEYVDRAKQRRDLYGTGIVEEAKPDDRSLPALASTFTEQQERTIVDPLGSSSVGHQILQKMGWNGGVVSGSSRSPADEARQAEQLEALSREWDRSGGGSADC